MEKKEIKSEEDKVEAPVVEEETPPIEDDEEPNPSPEDVKDEEEEGDEEEDDEVSKLRNQVSNLNTALRDEREKSRSLKTKKETSEPEKVKREGADDEDYYITKSEASKLAESAATEALSKGKEESRKKAEAKALKILCAKYPQYDVANDPSNTKFNQLAQLYVNRSGDSVEDIVQDLEDAHFLVSRRKTSVSKQAPVNPFDGDGIGPTVRSTEKELEVNTSLTADQKRIAKQFGMTDKEYAKQLAES